MCYKQLGKVKKYHFIIMWDWEVFKNSPVYMCEVEYINK